METGKGSGSGIGNALQLSSRFRSYCYFVCVCVCVCVKYVESCWPSRLPPRVEITYVPHPHPTLINYWGSGARRPVVARSG
jgi:hypothetical protein